MSTISAGNTTTTAFKVTADTTGNLTLTANATGKVILTSPLQFADGSTANTAASGGPGAYQAIQAANFTAVVNSIYAVNTVSATVYAALPASPSAGQYVTFVDYKRNFGANPLIITPNGSYVEGTTSNSTISTNGASVSLIYADSVQGWIQYSGITQAVVGGYSVTYLSVAGGGAAAGYNSGGGGGGAGGLLTSTTVVSPGVAYSIVIGGGGSGTTTAGTQGTNTTGLGITSVGGGGSGTNSGNGGSGAGSSSTNAGGSGTSGQGNSGGSGSSGNGYNLSLIHI